MKRAAEIFIIVMLFLSLSLNGYMVYHFYTAEKPTESVIKLSFNNHNVEVYCERSTDAEDIEADIGEGIFKIENAELVNEDKLYLRTADKEVVLSSSDSDAFVINSDGQILYQLEKPENENTEKVMVTPSGNKYHCDNACAGSTAFEVSLEIAELFGRTPCSICVN